MSLSVVVVGAKTCRPFIPEVLSPTSQPGYRLELIVDRGCTKSNDSLLKLVFDLFKEADGGAWQQIVHISFTREDADEERGVKALATEPVNLDADRILRHDVHPCAREVADSANPTPEQIRRLDEALRRIVRSQLLR